MKVTRNNKIDFIRGLLLIIIAIDHFTYQTISYYFSYFSAAEGFVFISGLVMGSYGISKYKSYGYKYLTNNLFKRVLKIYKYHIFTLVFFLLITILFTKIDSLSYSKLISTNILHDFIWGSTLIFKPKGLDILPMYICFVAISPFIIKLLVNGKIQIVIIASLLLWFLNFVFLDSFLLTISNNYGIPLQGAFSILSWQIIFISGLTISFLSKSKKLTQYYTRNSLIITSVLIIVVCFLLKYGLIDLFNNNLINKITDRYSLGPLRIINFAAITHIVYLLFNLAKNYNFENQITILGKYSIQVFTFHLISVIIFRNFLPLFTFEIFNSTIKFSVLLNNLANWCFTAPSFLILFIPIVFIKWNNTNRI